MDRPVLFCYDGSEGSKAALSVAAELVMHPADAVVLVVWTPVAVQLAEEARCRLACRMKANSTRRRSPLRNGLRRRAPRARWAGLHRHCACRGGARVGGQDDP